MTVKEYSALCAKIYADAVESSEDIRNTLEISGVAMVWEIRQADGKHAILVTSRKSQLNSFTLKELGFDPDLATAQLRMTLNRQTRCATL